MWAWLTDNPPGEKAKGWSGVYGLPRTLWLGGDGTLCMRPVKELETLRGRKISLRPATLAAGETKRIENICGDSCELSMEIMPEANASAGVKVRATPDGQEETLLYYDAQAGELVFDSTHSGSGGRKVIERAPFRLKAGEKLQLKVYVDRSVVEVFANDRQAICRRVYPTRLDSLGLALFAQGGRASFHEVQAWEMNPSNPY